MLHSSFLFKLYSSSYIVAVTGHHFLSDFYPDKLPLREQKESGSWTSFLVTAQWLAWFLIVFAPKENVWDLSFACLVLFYKLLQK